MKAYNSNLMTLLPDICLKQRSNNACKLNEQIDLRKRFSGFNPKMKCFYTIAVIGMLLMSACNGDANIQLPSIFSDNMVLQQNGTALFWGQANPEYEITVLADWGVEETTRTKADGAWELHLPVFEAGGPYTITIKGDGSEIVLQNVLVGEVWLASGQSNMEMPLEGWPPHEPIAGSKEAIADSDYPEIRMFTVGKNVSLVELNDLSGSWQVSSPETSGMFSATAWFFARKLHQKLGVPVGIIHSSWGGTPAEAWMSRSVLSVDRDFKDFGDRLNEYISQEESYNEWLSRHEVVDISITNDDDPLIGMDIFDEYGSGIETSVSEWPVMEIPTFIEATEVGDFDGVIWFRKRIEIPESWAGKELILSLGPIDDRDVTWFNGVRVGGMEAGGLWQTERIYRVAPELVQPGEAVIAVRMIDTQGGGGIYGDAELLKLVPSETPEEAISLAGDWSYRIVAEIRGHQMFLFNPEMNSIDIRPEFNFTLNSHTPTALFNAMIAPIVDYSLKGFIWYQGETNVGRANQYMRLKSMLVTDWRNYYGDDEMPFYYVQLAPWHYNDPEGKNSAHLREAQRRMQVIPYTGMISTLDIGDLVSIHPANKTDVGERLARWALAKDYQVDLSFSGPQPGVKTIEDGRVVVFFSHAGGGLEIRTDVPNQFEIAGENDVFYPADAVIEDDVIIFSSPEVRSPVNVRYAYRNGAVASLFNAAGLPAPSFTTENEIRD